MQQERPREEALPDLEYKSFLNREQASLPTPLSGQVIVARGTLCADRQAMILASPLFAIARQ